MHSHRDYAPICLLLACALILLSIPPTQTTSACHNNLHRAKLSSAENPTSSSTSEHGETLTPSSRGSNTHHSAIQSPTTIKAPTTAPRCGKHFDCGDGFHCVAKSYVCDTERDCTHGEDEQNCPKQCTGVNQFECQDGQCISLSRRCDASHDCWDSSDEAKCHDFPCNTTVHFRCVTNGACIDKKYRCDGTQDCDDNSDEKDCTRNSN